MKKSLHESGFSLLEGLILVLIVGIIGVVGYHVAHSNSNKDNKTPAVASPVGTFLKQNSSVDIGSALFPEGNIVSSTEYYANGRYESRTLTSKDGKDTYRLTLVHLNDAAVTKDAQGILDDQVSLTLATRVNNKQTVLKNENLLVSGHPAASIEQTYEGYAFGSQSEKVTKHQTTKIVVVDKKVLVIETIGDAKQPPSTPEFINSLKF
jgi:Tfp pilus assembly protein PilV